MLQGDGKAREGQALSLLRRRGRASTGSATPDDASELHPALSSNTLNGRKAARSETAATVQPDLSLLRGGPDPDSLPDALFPNGVVALVVACIDCRKVSRHLSKHDSCSAGSPRASSRRISSVCSGGQAAGSSVSLRATILRVVDTCHKDLKDTCQNLG